MLLIAYKNIKPWVHHLGILTFFENRILNFFLPFLRNRLHKDRNTDVANYTGIFGA